MKCKECKKEAEFYLKDKAGRAKAGFCNIHAIEYMKKTNITFLPRVEKKKLRL